MIRMVYKLYITILIPIRIPFEEEPHYFWLVCDIIINIMIGLNILVKFNTAYEDYESEGMIIVS